MVEHALFVRATKILLDQGQIESGDEAAIEKKRADRGPPLV
jgi:hypothetical protein